VNSLFVIVEGKTEQEFVTHVLRPHLVTHDVWATPIGVTTKRDPKTGEKLKQGGGQWSQWLKDIKRSLRSKEPGLRVTSMFDFYGLPHDFPQGDGSVAKLDPVDRVESLERAMGDAVDDRRFIPYLQRHEFESLVLGGLDHLREQLPDEDARVGLDALRGEIEGMNPEDVNDGKATAPSKRLCRHVPGYNKALHGTLVTQRVGVDELKRTCKRFGAWVEKLEALGDATS